MPRALWTGAISFGLVIVPVEMYPAEGPGAGEAWAYEQRPRHEAGGLYCSKGTALQSIGTAARP